MILKNCNVIDCTGRQPYKADVLIEGNVIKEIGNGLQGADVYDAQNGYLLPGFVNLHLHINRRNVARDGGVFRQGAPAIENNSNEHRMLYAVKNAWYELSQGVTTIRDLCSVGRTASALKDAIQKEIIHGPRVYVCGMGIAATGGHETHRYKGAVEVDGVDEVMKAARYEIKLGADFIKVMASGGLGGMPEHEHPSWAELTVEEIRAACEVAHSHNRGVTVHAMGDLPVMNSLLGGVDGIEHGTVLTERALEIMKNRGVYYVPTASGIQAVAEKERQSGNEKMAALMDEVVVFPQRESIRKAHQAGVLIGAGSDTLGSIPKELQIMHECGMTTYEALQTATINAAKILKNDALFGTVECGKMADLVLLKKNPLEDLEYVKDIQAVFLGGQRVNEKWMCNN